MLFNRVARVTVGPKTGGLGTEISNLRVAFEILKDSSPSPNGAKITISNLNELTRASIRENVSQVILAVGYETEDLVTLFQGSDLTIEHRVEPPEVETIISAGDGRSEIRNKRISLSLEPGCSVGQACKVVADRMDLELDDFGESDDDLPNGFNFMGPADTAMRQLAATAGLEYSVQNGRVQLLKAGAMRPGQGFLISPDTGLIGSPERVVKPDGKLEKKVPRVQWGFRCLLNPRLQIGERVRLESAAVTGYFRLDKIRHSGDTHGDDWFSECQVSAA